MQDPDFVAHTQRFEGIVRDQHRRSSGQKAHGEVLQVEPRHSVELGEWLVHEDNRPIFAEGSGKGRALAHAAGEGARQGTQSVAEADLGQKGTSTGLGSSTSRLVATQAVAQQHVVENPKPGKQPVLLRHVGKRRGTCRTGKKACEVPEQGRLAHTTATQQAGRLTCRRVKGQPVGNKVAIEGDARVAHGERRNNQNSHQSLRRH